MRRRLLAVALALATLGAAACAPAPPDMVLTGGRVFTATDEQPWAEALAIRGDRIVAVGTTAEVKANPKVIEAYLGVESKELQA